MTLPTRDLRQDRVLQHLPESDDLTLITLKGHLLVEEALDSIIQNHCKDKTALQGVEIGFYVKLKLAAALIGDPNLSGGWTMVEKLNSLRNALAHRLEHPLAKKRLNAFLALFDVPEVSVSLTGHTATDLRQTIAYLLGFIHGATDPTLEMDASVEA